MKLTTGICKNLFGFDLKALVMVMVGVVGMDYARFRVEGTAYLVGALLLLLISSVAQNLI